TTVSPGLKSGTSRVMRLFSISWTILLMALTFDYASAAYTRSEKFIQQPARLRSEAVARDQIRSPRPRSADRLCEPPAPHRGVIPGQQHLRHAPSLEHLRPRVMRPVEQPRGERLLDARALIAERARQQPHDRIDQGERGNLTAAQHEIPDRYLPIDSELDRSLIDAFISACDE